MQNLFIIFFPLLIDGLNSIAGLQNPRAKFWVAISTSLIGGILLNLSGLLAIIANPNPANIVAFLTLIGLDITAAQGIYVKYWEDHDFRQTLFPTVAINNVKSPIAQ